MECMKTRKDTTRKPERTGGAKGSEEYIILRGRKVKAENGKDTFRQHK